MGKALARVANEVGCSERTLRRYAQEGLIESRNPTGRGIELPMSEELYLKRHWALLSQLKGALRTERDVRLAVLFGSTARGDDRSDSDIDVMVLRHSSSQRMRAALSVRLRHSLERSAHLIDLEQAQESSMLLADILREGRPLLDREQLWTALRGQLSEVREHAAHEEHDLLAKAQQAVAQSRARAA